MNMKTAILVDSACSLPASLRKKYNVEVVPLSYCINEHRYQDDCTDESALQLFEDGSFDRKHEVFTDAPDPEVFERLIIKKIKEGSRRIVVQTVNRTQGETYNNANAGVARVKRLIGERDISLRVMDSRTVFAGQALMAIETIRRLLRSKDENAVRKEMDHLSEDIHTFILPKDPLTALERARERNEKSVGFTQALIASKLGIHPIICNRNDTSSAVKKIWGFDKAANALFEHISTRIDHGLTCPIITVNYCGPLEILYALPGYDELVQKAKANKLMLVPSVASLAGGIYASVGSLSVAVATPEHEWESSRAFKKFTRKKGTEVS